MTFWICHILVRKHYELCDFASKARMPSSDEADEADEAVDLNSLNTLSSFSSQRVSRFSL